MASPRQKTIKVGEVAMLFLELGRIPDPAEYRTFTDAPLRWATIKRLFGNWNRMLRFMEQTQPDLWKEVQSLEKPSNILEALRTSTLAVAEADDESEEDFDE